MGVIVPHPRKSGEAVKTTLMLVKHVENEEFWLLLFPHGLENTYHSDRCVDQRVLRSGEVYILVFVSYLARPLSQWKNSWKYVSDQKNKCGNGNPVCTWHLQSHIVKWEA